MSTPDINLILERLDKKVDRLTELLNTSITDHGQHLSAHGTRINQLEKGFERMRDVDLRDVDTRLDGLERERATNEALHDISTGLKDLRDRTVSRDQFDTLTKRVGGLDERLGTIEDEALLKKGKMMGIGIAAGVVGALAGGLLKLLAELVPKLFS